MNKLTVSNLLILLSASIASFGAQPQSIAMDEPLSQISWNNVYKLSRHSNAYKPFNISEIPANTPTSPNDILPKKPYYKGTLKKNSQQTQNKESDFFIQITSSVEFKCGIRIEMPYRGILPLLVPIFLTPSQAELMAKKRYQHPDFRAFDDNKTLYMIHEVNIETKPYKNNIEILAQKPSQQELANIIFHESAILNIEQDKNWIGIKYTDLSHWSNRKAKTKWISKDKNITDVSSLLQLIHEYRKQQKPYFMILSNSITNKKICFEIVNTIGTTEIKSKKTEIKQQTEKSYFVPIITVITITGLMIVALQRYNYVSENIMNIFHILLPERQKV